MSDMLNGKENVRELNIEDELKESYLTYAMSVIVSRALPDVRDGLKPSQRRILVAMNDLHLGPRSKYRKCAKICGDTSGNYHPHGEQVIYPTLVRMAQKFNCYYPLVDSQGNFGSIDGDPPAAMRYTEARMSEYATGLLEDLEHDTVDFTPNYDETRREPVVLPSKFPNLLANGSSGIAVGMATSIPPHNIAEVADGIIALINKPDSTVEELMKYVHGPDFPTGALICGRGGIREGYTTGHGILTVRARAFVESTRGGKKNIVINEIPYQVNKTRLIERIADLVRDGRIMGVADVRDESDREGMRIVVELRRGEDERVILNQLYSNTPLQDSFSINMIALVDGKPLLLNIKQMLQAYINHRYQVIRRRTKYLLDRAEEKAHILEGLIIAVDNIDEVVDIIKKSPDVPTAHARLKERFALSDKQAEAILNMRLQRLTGLEIEKLQKDYQELQDKIRDYKEILANDNLVYDIIREDMYEIKEKYRAPRRTEIVGAVEDFDIEDLIAEENVVVTTSHEGYIKRMPLSSYRRQARGGKGITGAQTKEGDFVESLFIASTHDYLLFFTDKGKVYWQKVYDIPQMSRTSRGRAIVNLLETSSGENITSMLAVRDFDKRGLIMVTENGVIKKTTLEEYGNPRRGGIIAINLDDKDTLISVMIANKGDDIILASRKGLAIRFSESQLRSQGRATRGVGGIKLGKGDIVVSAVIVDPNATLLTVCENGFGKRTPFGEYRKQKRNGKGVINIKTTARNGLVVGMMSVRDDDELMLITQKGMIIRCPVNDVRTISRNTQGVKLISLKEEDKLVGIARVVKEEEPEKLEKTNGAKEEDGSEGDKTTNGDEDNGEEDADSKDES